MIPTGELQWKKLQRKGWRDCHLLTLHYLAVSVNSVRKKVSEAKQILKCSSFPWRKVWETWVTYTAYNFLVVLSVFCKGNHNSIFFHSNQSHCTLKTDKSLAKNYSCDLWVIYLCLFSFFTALCQPQWPWRGLSVAPGTRSRCECSDKIRQSVSSLHRAAYSGHVSVVNLLIKYGADLRLCDSDGQIPLHEVTMKLLWFDLI